MGKKQACDSSDIKIYYKVTTIERVQEQADRSMKENRCENKLKFSVK